MSVMDSEKGKLFVGGTLWDTTEDALNDHFNQYGTVVASLIVRDRISGNSRGFGFVWFSDPSSADKALQDQHVIEGRAVEVKRARSRNEQLQNQQQNRGLSKNSSNGSSNNQFRIKKIFVGGLSASLTEEEFKSYFERFGRITDVVVMHDPTTHRPRGFGFITFDSQDSVENVMQKSFHELNGKLVEVKRAVPKEGNNNSNNGSNMRASGGRGSPINSYQPGDYPPYSPIYGNGIFPGYAPLSGYGGVGGYIYGAAVYGGGYPTGGYGGTGYGVPSIAPRSPWNGPGTVGATGWTLPYCNSSFYSGYMNGAVGLMGMASSGYNGIAGPAVNGKLNQVVNGNAHVPADAMPNGVDGEKLDVDSSGLDGSHGAASRKQNQRGLDRRSRPYPDGNSS